MLTLPYTETIDLKSNYSDFEYSLFIRFPIEYETNRKSYPTLFLLDAQHLFSICYGIQKIYEKYIIIGIGHKKLDFKKLDQKTRIEINDIVRPRDFLPWKLDPQIYDSIFDKSKVDEVVQASGQAENFAKFVNNQIVPLIDQKFRTTENRTLIGHSFGGVFTSFMLLCYPENFAKYIAITPVLTSAYYQEKRMLDTLNKKIPTSKKLAYFSIGADEENHRISGYVDILEKSCSAISRLPNLVSKVEILSGENHVSIVAPSIWRGLKFFDNNPQ